MKGLEDIAVKNKRVLVRVDLNVPFSQDSHPRITDDFRLRSILPTLYYLLEHEAKVILMGHLGKPTGRDEKLSLRPVYTHLAALLNKPILFAPDIFSDKTKSAIENLQNQEIIGLENLRFDKGESANSRTFARKLAEYGEIFVNDAFSVSHREAASLVAITEFLPSVSGLLLEKEVKMLNSLLLHPDHPFVAIIGGAKIADKLPLIKHLLKKANHILIGGGIANTFLAAQGTDVKNSLIEKDALETANQITKLAHHKIVLPQDFIWQDDKILDIGPATVELFTTYLKSAHTVFWNGCLGYTEDERYAGGSEKIAQYLADHPSTSVVGGGNTVEVLSKLDLIRKINFVSSGGGATLEFLSGRVLPGIAALN